MLKKLCEQLVLILMVSGLLFTASCEKKIIRSEPQMTGAYEDETSLQRKQAAEKIKDEEAESRRAIEEERIKEESLKDERLDEGAAKRAEEEKAARDRFVNEDIYFDFDKTILLPEAREVLRKKAIWLQNHPDVSVIIEGHCDERGTNEYNIALGERRAESAKAYLMNLGIPGSRITTISYGEERPVDPSNNEEAWAKNRRAHFVIETQ